MDVVKSGVVEGLWGSVVRMGFVFGLSFGGGPRWRLLVVWAFANDAFTSQCLQSFYICF